MEREIELKNIKSRIFNIRGLQVMLDSDLARFYETETKYINRAVQRNIDRFPDFFCFKLSEEEWADLRCQNGTLYIESKRGAHRKYLPLVFTEPGVAMLSAVLKSPTAIAVSISIIQSFIALRKLNADWERMRQRIDWVENRQLITDEKVNKLLRAMEKGNPAKSGIFFNNQIFDAYVFSSELIASAKKSIVLLDNYIDEKTLLQLSKRNPKVSCVVYTEKVTDQLRLDLEKHNTQYPPIEIRVKKHFHDRFLIIDEKELYHLGASLKDLGKRWFAFSRMDEMLEDVMKRLK
jgi:hypothetical protein